MNRVLPSFVKFVYIALLACSSFAWANENKLQPTDPAKGSTLYTNGDASRGITACVACHGAAGNSTITQNPKLAGQHADYLYKQLTNFKAKPGAKEPERNNAIMAAFAAQLSDQDMRNVAAHYAAQALTPSAAREKSLVEQGRNIYRAGIAAKGVPACAACHGPAGAGIPAQYPRLQGQYAEYTESQLTGFRQGARANNASMTTIAARLSDTEIKAVSDYIAGLR